MVSYWCMVVAAAVAATWWAVHLPGEPGAPGFMAYCFLACASASLKVKLPRVEGAVSLAFAFSFSALTELPVRHGLFIFALALLYDDLLGASEKPRWRETVFQVAATALAAVGAYAVFSSLRERLLVERMMAVALASATYYAVLSTVCSVRLGLQGRISPWRAWQAKFYWLAPLYLLAPLGIEATRSLWNAATYQRLCGLAMILLGYSFGKRYLGRLHDQEDQAQQMDCIRERTIESLAVAMEAKDGCTAGHLQRVKRHAARLARKLGLSEGEIRTLELAAVLHDVGKVGVPDSILGKPGRLTEQEFSQLALHTTLGAEIVSAAQFPFPVEQVILCHHEHWDGAGYPRQLAGEQIPILARVLTVADCFDALVSERPYRLALSVPEAVKIMQEQRGKIFDPGVLDVFLESVPEFAVELERELELERAQMRLQTEPPPRVQQTWVTEAESREMALRRQTMEKLSASPEQLLAIYDILETLGAEPEVEWGIKKALEQLGRVAPHDRAGVFVVEGNQYVLLQGEGIPDYCVSRLTFPAGNGLMALAAAAGRPIRVAGGLSDQSDPMGILYLGAMQHVLVAPLVAQDQVTGAVALWTNAPDGFTPEQEWFLGLLTRKLAAAVVSVRTLQKLRHEASTDPLTGLANARTAFQRLRQEMQRAYREGTSLAVLFLDLDQFKSINDTCGHVAGNRLLVLVAQTLQSRLREYDFLARMGGDEFLAVLPGIRGESVRRKIQLLEEAVAEIRMPVDDAEVGVTVSIGTACYPEDGCSTDELIFCSDQRMYAEKRAGGRGSEAVVAVGAL